VADPTQTDQLTISDIRQLFQRHQAFYEIQPYYVMVDGPSDNEMKKVHAGFDIDICGVRTEPDPWPPPDYINAAHVLQDTVRRILPHTSDLCELEVIPFHSSVFLDCHHRFRQQGILRIRITHCRGLRLPSAEPELSALDEVEQELQALGVTPGSRRLGG